MKAQKHATVVDLIQYAFQTHSEKPAYTCLGYTMTYAQVEYQARRFASFLQHHSGLKPGDRLALQLPNILQYPIALYGAAMAGVVVTNINPLYTPRELQHQLKDSGAKALLVLSNVAHNAAEIIEDTDVELVLVTEVGDLLPWPKRSIVNFVVKYVKKQVSDFSFAHCVSFNKALEQGFQPVRTVKPEPNDLVLLQYTGGTTGVAKGAMLTHTNLCSNVCQVLGHLNTLFKSGEEVAIAALPLYHIFAFNMHALCLFSEGAHNILIPNPRDIPAFVKAIAPFKISIVVAVNTLYNALMRNEDFKKLDFSHMRVAAGGGMALTEDVATRWQDLAGTQICEGYGLTETSPVIISNPDTAIRIGTVGTPLMDTYIRIVSEQGEDLPDGEPGEVWVKGPQVMKGYWQRPEATAEVMEDGWFKTGDIAIRNEDGYYKIVDRKKEMISVSGFKVFPNEVEHVVTLHPGIVEAAVIGVPADCVGEHVKLYAVRVDDSVTAESVIEHCRQSLTAYKVPKIVEFREDLPKSNVGKILRRLLREEYMAQHSESGAG